MAPHGDHWATLACTLLVAAAWMGCGGGTDETVEQSAAPNSDTAVYPAAYSDLREVELRLASAERRLDAVLRLVSFPPLAPSTGTETSFEWEGLRFLVSPLEEGWLLDLPRASLESVLKPDGTRVGFRPFEFLGVEELPRVPAPDCSSLVFLRLPGATQWSGQTVVTRCGQATAIESVTTLISEEWMEERGGHVRPLLKRFPDPDGDGVHCMMHLNSMWDRSPTAPAPPVEYRAWDTEKMRWRAAKVCDACTEEDLEERRSYPGHCLPLR